MMIGEKKWRLLLVKVVSSPSFPRSSCRKRVLALKRSRKRKSVDIRHFIRAPKTHAETWPQNQRNSRSTSRTRDTSR